MFAKEPGIEVGQSECELNPHDKRNEHNAGKNEDCVFEPEFAVFKVETRVCDAAEKLWLTGELLT